MTTKTATRITTPYAKKIVEEAAKDRSRTVTRAAQAPPPRDTRMR